MSFPTTLPESTAVPLTGGPTLRWGIIGAGGIAGDWTDSLHTQTDQRVLAVASRDRARADRFAADHGIERGYDGYEQLVADPEIDIVYVATTNNAHLEQALLVIAAGKHVLIEKPIAMNADEARQIAAAARAAGVFAMEAMWTRFQNKSSVIRRLLDDGVLGEVPFVSAALGFRFPQDPDHRMYDLGRGGGALLDLGVYSIWWNQFVLGTPTATTATGLLATTGVDDLAVVELEFPTARGLAIATARVDLDSVGTINGTDARLSCPTFLSPGGFTLHGRDGASLEYIDPSGLQWREALCVSAAAVADHVANGLTEAPEHTLDRSIAMMESIDAAQTAIGYGAV